MFSVRPKHTSGLAIALSLCLIAGHKAAAANFTFTNIADPSGSLRGFGITAPAINASGTVAFRASLDGGGEGIFIGDGSELTTIADTNGRLRNPFSQFGFSPDIDDTGKVAFESFLRSGVSGIFVGDGDTPVDPLTPLVDNSGFLNALGDPDLNNAGTVSFIANFDALVANGIFTTDGNSTTSIVDSQGAFALFGSSPAINETGTVAFVGKLGNGSSTDGIFTSTNGLLTTVVDTSGPFKGFGFGFEPAINDDGTLAFFAQRDTGEFGIFSHDNGVVTTLADTNSLFSSFGVPAINNDGTIAFFARLDTGSEGIFVGSDPLRDRVIAEGDSLFGSTVADLNPFSFSRKALNDTGQIAFFAKLEDGREVIVRADPIREKVPEASPIAGLLSFGALCTGICLKRQQQPRH